jgi:hypothetical protein
MTTLSRHTGLKSGLQDPPLPDKDSPEAIRSNILPNIMLGTDSTDVVEDLVRLQAEAAGDDFLLDLGRAAEVLPSQRCNRMPPRLA